ELVILELWVAEQQRSEQRPRVRVVAALDGRDRLGEARAWITRRRGGLPHRGRRGYGGALVHASAQQRAGAECERDASVHPCRLACAPAVANLTPRRASGREMPMAPPARVASTALVLASASPRRRWLLEALGVTFHVLTTDTDERPHAGEPGPAFVRRMAHAKARAAYARGAAWVLAADTIVELAGEIFGKPADAAAAAAMLTRLSA